MAAWPSPPSRSSIRSGSAPISRTSRSCGTASRSRSSTPQRRRRSRARCWMRCATSTSTRTRTCTAACTSSPSARPRATKGAREKVRAFVNAPSTREIVFTRSATESINLVAYAWGLDNLGPGDLVVVTELEHHSNFVPWQYIAKRTGAGFRMIPIDDLGELQLDALDGDRARGQRQGGRVQPRLELARHDQPGRAAGRVGARARRRSWSSTRAQAAPHRAVDVQSARLRLPRVLVAQDVRPVGRRRALGQAPSCSTRWRRSTSAAT